MTPVEKKQVNAEKKMYLEKIKEGEERELALEEELKKERESKKSVEQTKDRLERERDELRKEMDGLHAALSVLPGLPSRKVKIGSYSERELTVSARLFAWIAHVAFPTLKVMSTKEED